MREVYFTRVFLSLVGMGPKKSTFRNPVGFPSGRDETIVGKFAQEGTPNPYASGSYP